MIVALLLAVKARLIARSFLRRGGLAATLGLIGMLVVLSPFWLGVTYSAHRLVAARGAEGLVAVFGGVHLGWILSSVMLSGFAEGFDWRLLLRFPVPPSRIFLANVIIAPLDLIALFVLPPLLAAVLAAARTGVGPAAGAALAAILLVLISGTVIHLVLAAFNRFLRRDWSRAVGGIVFAVVCAAPIFALNHELAAGRRPSLSALADSAATPLAALGAALPTSALPAMLGRGAWHGDPVRVVIGALGGVLLLLLGVRVGAAVAAAAARQGENADRAAARATGAPASPMIAALARRLPSDLAVLVGRDLRYFVRTPQVLLGLLITPCLVVFFRTFGPMAPLGRYALPFFCLVSALNLSANAFGLDREGIRFLLLMPVKARRLLLAKNLACAVVVLITTALTIAAAAATGDDGALPLAAGGLATLAALPALLSVGNFLSVRHPWRMTFKIGGAPPGALTSATAQFAVVSAVAVLLALPSAAAALLVAPALRPFVELGGTLAIALVTWTIWAALLSSAGRHLERRTESLVATLGYPHETG